MPSVPMRTGGLKVAPPSVEVNSRSPPDVDESQQSFSITSTWLAEDTNA